MPVLLCVPALFDCFPKWNNIHEVVSSVDNISLVPKLSPELSTVWTCSTQANAAGCVTHSEGASPYRLHFSCACVLSRMSVHAGAWKPSLVLLPWFLVQACATACWACCPLMLRVFSWHFAVLRKICLRARSVERCPAGLGWLVSPSARGCAVCAVGSASVNTAGP